MIVIDRIDSSACRLTLNGLDDCRTLAEIIASGLRTGGYWTSPTVIGLVGTLGSGKTQWTKFFAQQLGGAPEEASSPTYVLVHRYETKPVLYHLDTYRVGDADEFLELGVEELFADDAITVVEWADRFAEYLPSDTLWIRWEPIPNQPMARRVTLENLERFPDIRSLLAALDV